MSSAGADSARHALRYIEEATWGTVPASALTDMRFTGDTLRRAKRTVTSEEIRADRKIKKVAAVGRDAQGGVNFELSYGGQFIPFLGALLFDNSADWTTPNEVTGSSDITFAAAGKTMTSAGAPSFDSNFVIGQRIQVRGTTLNGTDTVPKWFTITAVSATVITVAETVVDESNQSAQIRGSMIRDGTARRFFTMERQAEDLSNVFISYGGLYFDQMTLTFEPERIITMAAQLAGKDGVSAAATVGTGAAVEANTTDVMDASINVGSIEEGGSVLATAIKRLEITINNQVRNQPAIGSETPAGKGVGRCLVTGRITPYFNNLTLYNKFENHTLSSIMVPVVDAAGNRYYFKLPSVRYIQDPTSAPRADVDIEEPMEFATEVDTTTACQIQIDRFDAPS